MKSKLKNLILILCLGSILLIGCNHYTGLEGTWVGRDIQKPLIDWTLTVHANQFYLIREDLSMWYIGKFSLNNNCLLKKIDLKFSDTHIQVQHGITLLGIYEIDGNSLTLMTCRPGSLLRPSSFDEYDKAVVFNFMRS
ncbi:MAG: hypothetical protein PVI55_14100 [Desulfobacterales bacterium]|jgi:uncharacterized protein (TIGR03067 family)